MNELYFYDMPIYRLTSTQYEYEWNRYLTDHLDTIPDRQEIMEYFKKDPRNEAAYTNMVWKHFGGPWRFNEIIGYIRLFFTGYQIHGQLWRVDVKRFVRTRRKMLLYQSNYRPEVNIPLGCSNREIFDCILKFLDSIRLKFKDRFIDSSILEQIGPYIDWNSLLQKSIINNNGQ